jgi:hypothetical protein
MKINYNFASDSKNRPIYMMMNKDGRKLNRIIKHLCANGSQKEFELIIGKSQPTISGWLQMERFSDTVLRSLDMLREKGINTPDFFLQDGEPMLITEVKTETELRNIVADQGAQIEAVKKFMREAEKREVDREKMMVEIIAILGQSVKGQRDLNDKLTKYLNKNQ